MADTRNPCLERQGLARDSASRAGHLEHFPITNNRKMLGESSHCRVFEPENRLSLVVVPTFPENALNVHSDFFNSLPDEAAFPIPCGSVAGARPRRRSEATPKSSI
jgi:hypothetical protein